MSGERRRGYLGHRARTIGATIVVVMVILIIVWTFAGARGAWVTRAATENYGDALLVQIAADTHGILHVLNSWYNDGYDSVRYHSEAFSGDYTVSGGGTNGITRGLDLAVDEEGVGHFAVVTRSADPSINYIACYHYAGPSNFGSDYSDWGVAPVPPSITVDSHGSVHLTYCKNESIVYATDAGGNWSTRTLISFATPDQPSIFLDSLQTSIGIDSHRAVHVLYMWENAGSVGYLTNASGEWKNEFIWKSTLSIGGPFIDLAVDSLDGVHVCFHGSLGDSIGLLYGVNRGSGWGLEFVRNRSDRPYLSSCSIAVDRDERPRMAYGFLDNSLVWRLDYLTRGSDGWHTTEVISTTESISSCTLTLGPKDVPYVGFALAKLPRYATNSLSLSDRLHLAAPGIALACVVAVVGTATLWATREKPVKG